MIVQGKLLCTSYCTFHKSFNHFRRVQSFYSGYNTYRFCCREMYSDILALIVRMTFSLSHHTTSKETLFKYIHKIMEWVTLKYKKYIFY